MDKAMVILCGGDSSRMGTDKALLPFKDKTLVEYIIDKFSNHFNKVYLSVNKRGDYAALNLNAIEIPDMLRNAGPIGGILSALSMVKEEKAFFMSIDTPFLDPLVANYLFENSKDYDVTSFDLVHELNDAVCAIYSKHCLSALGKCIVTRNTSKENFYSKCSTQLFDMSIIEELSVVSKEQQFFAIKDREAYYMSVFSVLKNNFTC